MPISEHAPIQRAEQTIGKGGLPLAVGTKLLNGIERGLTVALACHGTY